MHISVYTWVYLARPVIDITFEGDVSKYSGTTSLSTVETNRHVKFSQVFVYQIGVFLNTGHDAAPTSSPDVVSLPETRGSAITTWIDAHPFRAFLLLTIFYVGVTASLSSLKLLWLDELITLHIARLGSPSAIWHALAEGADPNPPLVHLAVLACMRLLGQHAYVFRLPAILGYWVGMLSLFLFLKRRVQPTWALIGTLSLMGMGSFEWSYESRSYALFFGTTMMGLYCWVLAVDPSRSPRIRNVARLGMTIALAAGLCANYFAILAFLPLVAGEITRTLRSARPLRQPRLLSRFFSMCDGWIWGSFVIAVTPLLCFRPLAEKSIALYAPYAWNKVSFDMTNIAYLDMVEAMLVPLGILVLSAGGVWILSKACSQCLAQVQPPWFSGLLTIAHNGRTAGTSGFHELVAVFTLLVYPYLGWTLASLHGGMLSSRFVIPLCFGFAISATWIGSRSFAGSRSASVSVLCFFLLWFMVRESYVGFSYHEQKEAFYSTLSALKQVDQQHEPIVVSDNLLILPFRYYAPADVASRVVYPVDMEAIMRRRGEASGEVNLWIGRTHYDFLIMPLAELQRSVFSYVLITSEPDWLLDDLNAHRYDYHRLHVDTHAEPLNYVATPLSHFKSVLFRVYGDQRPSQVPLQSRPIPFDIKGELPEWKKRTQ